MEEFVRFLVIGKNDLRQHSYASQIKGAFSYAVECSEHYTMRGDVYGEKKSGERVLLKEYKQYASKEESKKLEAQAAEVVGDDTRFATFKERFDKHRDILVF